MIHRKFNHINAVRNCKVMRGAWELVVDQGLFAQRNTAPSHDGAVFVGETDQISSQRSPLVKVRTFFKDKPTWE
jgi:hypothetical protein